MHTEVTHGSRKLRSCRPDLRRKSLFRAACIGMTCLSLLGLLAGCGRAERETTHYTIAVVPKGTTAEFWQTVHAGVMKAARELPTPELSLTVHWNGPLREDDREQQIQVVEGFISQGVDGICLAPLDDKSLVRPVEEAARARIPTVIFDSGLDSDLMVSFVATDNRKGGELAGQYMGKLLHGKGKVILLRYQEGSASTREREEGFLNQLRSHYPGLELISADQYAGPTRETAKRASENLLNRFGGVVDGIFCPNESSTSGMLLALEDLAKAGQVAFIGFDSSEAFIQAMREGKLQGLVVQNPHRMGYLAVKTMLDHLQGKSVEKRIDTGVVLITMENLDTPEVQQLIGPQG